MTLRDTDTPPADARAQARALLGRSPIFTRCTADDLVELAAGARFVDHANSEDIVREGDPAHPLLIIEHGEGRLLKRGASGGEHAINRLGAGDSIGEMALFDRVPRSATLRAVGPVRSLVLPLASVVALAETRPSLVPVLVDSGAQVARRLRTASDHAAAAADRADARLRVRLRREATPFQPARQRDPGGVQQLRGVQILRAVPEDRLQGRVRGGHVVQPPSRRM